MTTMMNHAGKDIARAAAYAGALALKGAASLMPDGIGRAALRRAFARNLTSLRGLPMKLSQVIAMNPASEEGRLHREALANLPAMGAHDVRNRLESLAPALSRMIADFSATGIPASLGQVHRTRLSDGRDCAIKVKYPGIASGVKLDVGALDMMLGLFSASGRGFPVGAYREMLAAELQGELDYRAEARKQARFHAGFSGAPGIVIPRPYPAESGDEHILMDWESSIGPAAFAAGADTTERGTALDRISGFLTHSLFGLGIVHADPHPGNFGFRTEAGGLRLVVYDYGSAVALPSSMPAGLLEMLRSVRDGEDPYPHLLALGFAPEPLEPIRARLPVFCELIFAPFLSAHPLLPGEWNRKERAALILGAHRWNFMIAAPVTAFPLMRALHGLVHYAELLRSPLHLRPRVDALLKRGPAAPAPVQRVLRDSRPAPSGSAIAETLKVEVRSGGEILAALTFPRDAVNRLADLLEPGLKSRIEAKGIVLEEVSERARRGGYRPGELFTEETGGKSMKVWLE